MKSLTLVCEPRSDSFMSTNLCVILNLDKKQIEEIIALRKKIQRAITKSGINKNSIQHMDIDDELTFWLADVPSQFDASWQEDGETLSGDEDEDYLWRIFTDKELDEDQMNIDMERLDLSSMRLTPEGVCFSAYIKHNPTRFETAVISWDDLDELRDKFPKPVKRKKQKVK